MQIGFDGFAQVWFAIPSVEKLDSNVSLDPNANFRNYLQNLDIHNFGLDYPWVMHDSFENTLRSS